jgi:hypothetical protein
LLHALPEEALRGFPLGRIVRDYRRPAHAVAGIVQRLARIAQLGLANGLDPAIGRVAELGGRGLAVEGRGDGAAASGREDRQQERGRLKGDAAHAKQPRRTTPVATSARAGAFGGILQEHPMKALSVSAALLMAAGAALAQTGQRPANDPLAVKPIQSEAKTTDTDMIRSKIERMGYTDVTGLSRDSLGVWRAKAKRGAETVDITVDKGGRIKTEPQ